MDPAKNLQSSTQQLLSKKGHSKSNGKSHIRNHQRQQARTTYDRAQRNGTERKTTILNMNSEIKRQQKIYQQTIRNISDNKPKPRLDQNQERKLIVTILDTATNDQNIVRKIEET